MNFEEKNRYEKNWKWCQEYWTRKTKELKLSGWKLKVKHMKTSLGECEHSQKIISLSSHFLRGPSCEPKKMRNTLLHEIAHALVGPNFSHGPVWKKKCLEIGGDGQTYATMDKPPGNYLLFCPNKCFKREYYRKPKIGEKVCLKCKGVPKLKTLKK